MVQASDRPQIVVTGDITLDWNLARLSDDRVASTWDPNDTARVCAQAGGAAMLAQVVGALAERRGFELRSFPPPRLDLAPANSPYPESYATWAPHANPHGVDPPWAWRVTGYLGLDRARAAANGADPALWQVVDDPEAPAVIVLDDAGLGLRERPELWPRGLQAEGASPWVLVKMAQPVATGALWEHLSQRCAERLVAVTTIGDLRRTEVHISQGLSWERTAQDLYWELVHNPAVNSLARCAHVVVSCYAEGALLLSRRPGSPPAWDCRLIFDPAVSEGGWRRGYPGGMIGYTTALCAGLAWQLMKQRPDIEQGVQSGLAAMRALHVHGYGPQPPGQPLCDPGFPVAVVARAAASNRAALAAVAVENPVRRLALRPEETAGERGYWTILDSVCAPGDAVCGTGESTLTQTAERIVLEGPERALAGVPICRFGDLSTADRREAEGYRSIARLMQEYCDGSSGKPLAIAVFGPPGAGKSFGVTQVATSLTGVHVEVKTFNLSQFGGPEELVNALHQVRDVGLKGAVPLVFWDEFDTDLAGRELGWLRYFLAPIQDGAFQDGQLTHHTGRAIFVFAGGTSPTMAQFDRGCEDARFVAAKGPDFVSRLKGYVNIMGPDPQPDHPGGDAHHLIRRALLLRSLLLRNARAICSRGAGGVLTPRIDPGLLHAFLHVRRYQHGVRSMEAIIAMSALAGRNSFTRSCLPAEEQLNLHVNGVEFLALTQLPRLEGRLLDALAAATHEVYRGSVGSYAQKPAHADQPYEALPPELRAQNEDFVRNILAKLSSIGYTLIPARSDDPPMHFPGEHEEVLAEAEHERWMRLKLAQGYRYGERDEQARLNPNLLPWGELSDEQKQWDRDLVKAIPRVLAVAGYTVIPLDAPPNGDAGGSP